MTLFQGNLAPLARLALPLVATGLLQSSVFFFETLFLARLGPHILAAGALVSWLFSTLIVVLYGILSAINILIAHQAGADNHQGIARIMRDGFWLAAMMVIPAFLLCWNMAPVFLLFGQDPDVILLSQAYLRSLAWGILPEFLTIAFLELIIGLGHAHLMLTFSLLSVSCNILFSYLLIFGKFGLPALGIAGAGWGISISYWITFLLLSLYLLTNKAYKPYFRCLWTFSKQHHIWELLKVGTPMGLMYCVEVGFFFVLTLIMGVRGSYVLAANQVAMQYLSTVISVNFSIAQAITIHMGHLLGAEARQSAQQAAYAGMSLSFLLMLMVALIYWFFPLNLIAIDFNIHKPENRSMIVLATEFLALCALFQMLEALRISLFGALRSLKDTHFTLLISMLGFWGISLPSGYGLLKYLNLGAAGLWWGMILGSIASIVLLFWRFKKHFILVS